MRWSSAFVCGNTICIFLLFYVDRDFKTRDLQRLRNAHDDWDIQS